MGPMITYISQLRAWDAERGSGFPTAPQMASHRCMPRLPPLWVTCALPLQETLGRVVGSGLPALLLQCLYLFFAFPVEKDELLEGDVQGQRMFVQVSGQGPGLLMP